MGANKPEDVDDGEEDTGVDKKITAPSPALNGGGVDSHPYARGSVIEVLHGVKEDDEKETFWWSDSEEDDEEEESDEAKDQEGVSVRLCDVIDRVPAGDDSKWRYYVHYRDFNRRMDEWVAMDKIISPPSVGNAKARALKKQEEKIKRKLAKLEEEKQAAAETMQPRGPRGARRDVAVAAKEVAGLDETSTPRMTRRQRRKTDILDLPLPNLDGSTNSEPDATPVPPEVDAEKEIVTIATTAKAETTKAGQHFVATIPAQELDEHEGLDEASLREHEEVTKVKNVAFLELGEYRMETWYFTPLPKELLSEHGFVEILYVCEFSFNMFARKSELLRFQARELPKNRRHPPGNEIYRHGNISMFEVDGFEERIYCQNLCYIAKLFLDHKTLYFDVDPFLFYVLCEVDDRGFHPVGYYSKEKYSDVGYNLACILTFPSHQRKGYGRFLIAFSYELSKKEEKVGSPEKPMSDLGQKAYIPYWMSTILDFLLYQASEASSISIMDIAKKTSIMAEDIVFTLNQLGILKIISGVYFIAADQSLFEQLAKKHPVKEPRVHPLKLHWSPFLTDIKRDKFSIHSKKPTLEKTATVVQQQEPQTSKANKK